MRFPKSAFAASNEKKTLIATHSVQRFYYVTPAFPNSFRLVLVSDTVCRNCYELLWITVLNKYWFSVRFGLSLHLYGFLSALTCYSVPYLLVSLSKTSHRKCYRKREKKAIAFKNLLLNMSVSIGTENELVTWHGRIILIFPDNAFALASSHLNCPFPVKQCNSVVYKIETRSFG